MNMCKDVKGRKKKKRRNGRRVAPPLNALVCGVLIPGHLLPYPKAAVADLLFKIPAVVFSCAMLPSPQRRLYITNSR